MTFFPAQTSPFAPVAALRAVLSLRIARRAEPLPDAGNAADLQGLSARMLDDLGIGEGDVGQVTGRMSDAAQRADLLTQADRFTGRGIG